MGWRRCVGMGLCGLVGLGAADVEPFLGVRIHVAAPMGRAMHEDVRGHLGCGIGLVAGLECSAHQAFRLSLDYTGTHVTGWQVAQDQKVGNPEPFREFRDVWRAFRLGVEHVLQQDAIGNEGAFVFYGGGLQEAWVNRTEGSYLEAFLLGVTAAMGSTQGAADLPIGAKATAQDTWSPYATAGVGFRLGRLGVTELRYLACHYGRDRTLGLRTGGSGPVERRVGHLLILSWGVGF